MSTKKNKTSTGEIRRQTDVHTYLFTFAVTATAIINMDVNFERRKPQRPLPLEVTDVFRSTSGNCMPGNYCCASYGNHKSVWWVTTCFRTFWLINVHMSTLLNDLFSVLKLWEFVEEKNAEILSKINFFRWNYHFRQIKICTLHCWCHWERTT